MVFILTEQLDSLLNSKKSKLSLVFGNVWTGQICCSARAHHVTLSSKEKTADYYFIERPKLR